MPSVPQYWALMLILVGALPRLNCPESQYQRPCYGTEGDLAILYLDTSALLKLFIRESGTDVMIGLAVSPDNRLAISSLAPVELRSAVRRRQRSGDLPKLIAEKLLDYFDSTLAEKFLQQPVTDAVISESFLLIDRHALRALDAIQLASCKVLQYSLSSSARFICSDLNLIEAAQSERLECFDPVK